MLETFTRNTIRLLMKQVAFQVLGTVPDGTSFLIVVFESGEKTPALFVTNVDDEVAADVMERMAPMIRDRSEDRVERFDCVIDSEG